MSVDELEARERAEKWLRRDDGSIATRENSINEETMALDVVELLNEVARLRVANAALILDGMVPATEIALLDARRSKSGSTQEPIMNLYRADKTGTWHVLHRNNCEDPKCVGCKRCERCGELTKSYGFEDHICFNCRNPPSD